eukprot:scaffold1377_cov220-Pinguiococcus_pyrenoidosus.AAC.2
MPSEAIIGQARGRIVGRHVLVPIEPCRVVVLAEEARRLAAIRQAEGVIHVVLHLDLKGAVVARVYTEEVRRDLLG